jgi:hypothetical protein
MILSGCHRLQNKLHPIELECGPDASTGETYMKFLHSQDAEIQQAEENLFAYHVADEDTQSANAGNRLPVSSKGCVAIPASEGRVDVFTKIPRQGLSIPLQKSQQSFSKHRLLPINESPFGFVCPLDGYFAVDSLAVPLLVPIGPSSPTERNRIVAYDEATKSEVILFEKPFGESSLGEMKLFNTSSLKPGEYLLKSSREVIDLRTGAQLTVADIATCPLTIVEKSPNLPDTILRLPESSIVPLGSKLNLLSPRHSEMKFCRNQKGSPSRPQKACSKAEDFEEAEEVLNQEEGIWDYCFLLENRLGQKSEIVCKEVRVSGTKPAIDITVDSPAITTDLPILDFPVTKLKYKVATGHKFAIESDLLKSQMCRVEFSFHGQVNLATDKVTCLSDTCRGKSLQEFAPCGNEVEIDISGLYKTDLIDKAYLKFIVRADDGAGNVSTQANSVLIHKDRWEYVALTGPGTNMENETLERLFPISDDRVHILTKSHKIYEYSPATQGWNELLDVTRFAPEGSLEFINLVLMPDRTVYSLWQQGDQKKVVILQRKPGQAWEHLSGAQSPPGCSWLSKDLAGHLYCQDQGLLYVQNNRIWKDITPTDNQGEKICRGFFEFFSVENSQWIYCGGSVYSRPSTGSPWSQRKDYGTGFPGYMMDDKSGNIWISSDEWSDEFFVGYYDNRGQWNDAVNGKALTFQKSSIGTLSLSRSGDIQYGSFIWNSSLEDWTPRYSFRNPLEFNPLNNVHETLHDSFQLWDSSLVISLGPSDYMFTFPTDRWDLKSSAAVIDYHPGSQQFFSVVDQASADAKQLILIRKRHVMNWLPVVTESQQYDSFELGRLNNGETFFFAGNKTIYRQSPEFGNFEVYRRFSDIEDVISGVVNGQIVFSHLNGKTLFDVGGGTFLEFKIPQDLELNPDQFIKDGQLWATAAKTPMLHRISADGAVRSYETPAVCVGGTSTLLSRTASHVYTWAGASICQASLEDMVFRPLHIPDYRFDASAKIIARLSPSRLALRASDGESEPFYIVDLGEQTMEGPIPLPAESLLSLQESPKSQHLFALYGNRVDQLVNGTWMTVITSEQISENLGRSSLDLKSLAVDQEDSFLLATDAAPLLRIFLTSAPQ